MSGPTRTCTWCELEHPLASFPRYTAGSPHAGRPQPWCRACRAAYQRVYRGDDSDRALLSELRTERPPSTTRREALDARAEVIAARRAAGVPPRTQSRFRERYATEPEFAERHREKFRTWATQHPDANRDRKARRRRAVREERLELKRAEAVTDGTDV